MSISKNFKRSEFACKCGCGFAAVDIELLNVLEGVRMFFDSEVIITNACRCENHNKAVGGSPNSQHKNGLAADIVVKNYTPADVFDYLEETYPDSYGIGQYPTFTHIDVRKNRARWRAHA